MQTHRNLLVVSLIATLFVVSSCKSCKNKFAKKDTAQETTSTLDTSMYAGLADTSNHTSSSATTSTDASSSSGNSTTTSSSNSVTSAATTASSGSSNSSSDKKMAADVEKSSSQHGSRRGGVSYSIYDGINDQEERYVVRKAEGYNDAYYIDDYNGTNKFYEEHYKKASKLEKPMADYIDKSMNLPSNAYANGPTQKIVDQQLHQEPTPEESKTKPAATSGGTGTIGISKKSLEKKPK